MPSKGVNIIHHRGDPQQSRFMDEIISRQDRIFVPELNGLVTCTPYDNHFIFEVPRVKEGVARGLLRSLQSQVRKHPELATYITSIQAAIHAKDGRNTVEVPGPSHMCTCGSMAVFREEEPVAFVCYFYELNGFHQTGVVNKRDFAKTAAAGQVLSPKARKWI